MIGRFKRVIQVIFLFLSLLTGMTQYLFAQNARPFEVKNTCIGNPDCAGNGASFYDPVREATAWSWDFGAGIPDTTRAAVHAFSSVGAYPVTLTRTLKNGSIEQVTQTVNIGQFQGDFKNWKTDTTICPGNQIVLDPFAQGGAPAGAKYLWYPKGDTTQTLTVEESGCYSVEVTYPDGCKVQNLVNVKICLESAGNQGAKWFFGNGAGLEFKGGAPTPLAEGKTNTKEGTSVISNSKGELLFYSDGVSIFREDGDKMPCLDEPCEDLAGSPDATQTVLIVPQPTCRGCEYLYNVFTTSSINSTEKVLSVSVVDMRQDQGKGLIVEQNRILHNNSTERLVSSRNDQDTTYWTVSHDYASNTFRIFHATESGLEEKDPFSGGVSHDAEHKGEGQMKFSAADSTGLRQLAVVVPGPDNNYIDLFDFNDEDGSISHKMTLDLGPAPPTAYGVEFSTDRTKLYVTFMGNDSTDSRLVQYDLEAADKDLIVESAMPIDSSANLIFGSLQAAPDGKIYMAIEGVDYLAVIGEPNDSTRTVSLLDYKRDGVKLNQKNSQLGLPNFVQNFTMPSDGPGFGADGFCLNDSTKFQASPLCDPIKDTYSWDFGDGNYKSGKEQEVSHIYAKPGIYEVKLTITNECTSENFSKQIEIFDVPNNLDIGGPIVDTCAFQYELKSNVAAKEYRWVQKLGANSRIVSRDRSYTVYPPGGDFVLYAWNDPLGECVFSDDISIVLRRPPKVTIEPEVVLCKDSSATVSVVENAWKTFEWSTGETSRELTVKQPGSYWVQAVDANGCVNRDTIDILEKPKPKIAALLTGPTGCETNDGVITINQISPGPMQDYNFEWMDVSGASLGPGNVLLNKREGAYTLRMSGNDQACTADTTLHLRSPANNLNLKQIVTDASCTDPEGGGIKISIISGKPDRFWWYDESGREISTADTAGNLSKGQYSLMAKDAGGCSFTLKPIVIGMIQNNLADLGPDLAMCEGDPVEIEPLAVDFPHNNFLWSTGETTRIITVTQLGTYKLTASNSENGCSGDDEIRVYAAPNPVVKLPDEYGLCLNEPNSMITLVPEGRPGYLYYWPAQSDSTQTLNVNQLGTYLVRVTNPEGCTVDVLTKVLDKCEPKLVIPSAFSPNGDGFNEVMDVIGLYLTDFDLKVYNRWGEVIFASKNLDHKWDGRYKDVKVQPGVYAYVATYKSSDYPKRPRYKVRGAITVVR